MGEDQLREDFEAFLKLPGHELIELTEEMKGALLEYGRILIFRSAQLNLISQEDRPRFFTRHLSECLVPGLVHHARKSRSFIDIGSGGGLPGLPLAIVSPKLRVLLIEPRQRKAQFLEATVMALGLSDRVKVFQGTAEKLARESSDEPLAQLVTARAVDRLNAVWNWSLQLLSGGGWLGTFKGPSEVDAELESLGTTKPAAIELFPCGDRPRVVLMIQKPR